MTEVILIKTANHIVGFECLGHSGFARRGKDIVCSAISTLTINTVNSLEKIADVDIEVKTKDKAGYLYCCIKGEPKYKIRYVNASLRDGFD